MAVKLKRLVSEAGAGHDKSFGVSDDNPDLFTLLKALADTQNEIIVQLNEVIAVGTPVAVIPGVDVES